MSAMPIEPPPTPIAPYITQSGEPYVPTATLLAPEVPLPDLDLPEDKPTPPAPKPPKPPTPKPPALAPLPPLRTGQDLVYRVRAAKRWKGYKDLSPAQKQNAIDTLRREETAR